MYKKWLVSNKANFKKKPEYWVVNSHDNCEESEEQNWVKQISLHPHEYCLQDWKEATCKLQLHKITIHNVIMCFQIQTSLKQ